MIGHTCTLLSTNFKTLQSYCRLSIMDTGLMIQRLGARIPAKMGEFLAHLVYQPKGPVHSCFVSWHWCCRHLCTPPCHRIRHRNIIFDIPMQICPPYVHIKYLIILTFSFKWQPFWYFSLIFSLAHIHNHRNFIFGVSVHICTCYMLITFLVILT